MIKITNLTVSVDQKLVLKSINLEVSPGTVHVLMGRNGSGKSTLAHVLMGHPFYPLSSGTIHFNGNDISHMPIDKRAQEGIFLAFQNPIEIPGVTVFAFLKEAYAAITKKVVSIKEFQQLLFEQMDLLQIDHAFAYRDLNVGFSGGEKKRLELLQLLILRPKLAILDEIDSGLDVDAIKVVGQGLQVACAVNPSMSIILITHYPRLLAHLEPDTVHIMSNGTLIARGDANLAHAIEQRGYDVVEGA